MGPLNEIKVLDFTHGVAGPFATMLLGTLGCDVIKVEKPGRGDASRYMNVSDRFRDDIPQTGGDYYLAVNSGKRAIALDLQHERGRQIALDLAKWADIAVQNFRPGVMTRLGLDYEAMRTANPQIIYASLSAYGTRGPLADQPGMDVGVQARSGVMSITGYAGSEPVKPGVSLADFSGGVHLVVAIMGALVARQSTGLGQAVDVSLLDATMMMLANYSVAVMDGNVDLQPMGSGHPQLVPFQAFPTADGFIVIATGTNKLFRELCVALDLVALIDDPRFKTNPDRVQHRSELIALLSRKTQERSTTTWLTLFEEKHIPCSPVNTMRQAFQDPQLRANDMVIEMAHPAAGLIHLLGVPYKFSQTRCSIEKRPPMLGEHTQQVLTSVIGMPMEEIERLAREGIVGLPKQPVLRSTGM